MESVRTHHAFHIQFSPPWDTAVRVSIGSRRHDQGWRPVSCTVAGFGGGVMTMLMFLGLKSKERARWANQGGGWFVGTEDPS